MFCFVYRRYDRSSSFCAASTNFKLEAIKAHARSDSHKQTQMRFGATRKPEATVAHKMLMKLNQKTIEQMKILFRSTHALAKHGRPFSDFQWLCSLDEAKGLKVGTAYRNDKRCKNFVKAIAINERNITLSLVEKGQFLSMVSDGSPDSSHREAEICYVRLAVHREIFTKFVGLKNIGKANADGISEALTTIMTGSFGSVWKTKVVGFGTDDASVMMESNNGKVKKMKDQLTRPYILAVHCSAHRLELA